MAMEVWIRQHPSTERCCPSPPLPPTLGARSLPSPSCSVGIAAGALWLSACWPADHREDLNIKPLLWSCAAGVMGLEDGV